MENEITQDSLTLTLPVPKKEQLLANSPMPCFTAEHKVIWNGVSLSWGGLPWLCPFPDSHPPQTVACEGRVRHRESLDIALALFSIS